MLTRFYRILVPALSLLCTVQAKAIALSDLLPAHRAQYSLYKSGFPVAESRFHLTYEDGKIDYSSETELSGLASLFSNDQIKEHSRLILHDGDIRLLSYSYQQTGDTTKNMETQLDWSGFKITTTIDQAHTIQTPFNGAVWDKLSVNLALIYHVKLTPASEQPEAVEFQLTEDGQMKSYRFEYIGKREIEVHSNEWIKTVIWKRLHDANKSTIIYLAPALHYLPVQMEQYKHDKLRATLKLDQADW